MKLSESQLEIIDTAKDLTNYDTPIMDETHSIDEWEMYGLVECLVEMVNENLENPLNDAINELYNKLDVQNKLINELTLKIAELREKYEK